MGTPLLIAVKYETSSTQKGSIPDVGSRTNQSIAVANIITSTPSHGGERLRAAQVAYLLERP